jgi:amino acid adenylation domain-containing protein
MTINNTRGVSELYPSEKCLHDIFQQQVEKTPHKIALVYENQQLTFAELNEKANQLGHFLRALGVGQDQLVALCLERSIDMIIGIFGILKAGGAYVPIDVDYPEDRRNFMLEDAEATVLLTHYDLLPNFENTKAHVVCLDTDWQEIETTFDKTAIPKSGVEPNNLAYTIYTSGSTGRPKGVMIEHQHIVNQLQGQHAIAPTPIDKMLLTCSISFDVSVLTIFWSLLQGSTLVLPRQGEEKDIQKLSNIIEKQQVSHILTLPSLHTLILEQANPQQLKSLRLINVSGEVCPTSMTQKHEKLIPWCQLYNLYGPTEAAVNCTYFTIPKGFSELKVPIGVPILNYEMFILDADLNEVKGDEIGEIYIGGAKPVVGRGYWNRPALTAQKFIQNPHQKTRGGDTLYNTGDLGRWMPDGNIEFLGRSDFQVKYRGFRIELGEIEVAIGNHPNVKETVVLLRNQEEIGNQKLVAYLTLNDSKSLNINELRSFLGESLPEYMLPSHFVFLEKMPLTTNGKFDRNALPEPTKERPALAQSYEAPESSTEKYLTNLWEQTLEIAPIGRHDKFFELGGNSILAAKFIGRLQKDLDASIFITTIFDHPTVASYAALLEEAYAENLQYLNKETTAQAQIADTSRLSVISTTNAKIEADNQVSDTLKVSVTSRQKPQLFIEDFTETTISNTKLPTGKLTKEAILNFNNYIPKTLESASSKTIDDKNPPAVFILAPPRSGTTLLRVMLAGHPNLFAANELQLLNFERLTDRDAAYAGKFALWKEGLVRVFMKLQNCNAQEAKELIAEFAKSGTTTKDIFLKIQTWIGDKILVDKSPSYAIDLAAMQKAERDFENPIYIHLVRHPYSMAVSFEKYRIEQVLFLEKNPHSGRQLGELVWLESHRNVETFLKDVPTERHIQVLYEDLVREPERIMRAICEKIGIEYHENLIHPYRDLEDKMIDGIHQDSRSMGDTNFDKKHSIDSKMADHWKGVFNDDFLSETSWNWIEKLGYPTLGNENEPLLIEEINEIKTEVEEVSNQDDLHSNYNLTNPEPKKLTLKTETTDFAESIDYQDVKEQDESSSDIAIIGMSCRVAGANNIFELWQNLLNAKDVSHEVTVEDLENAGENLLDFSKENYVKRTLTLDHGDCFDAGFFGYLPKEAELMDPQHRVFLETAYSALEISGYNPQKYDGKIGIFGGVARNAYFTNNVASDPKNLKNAGDYLEMMSSEKAFSTTRVAYKLNLKGPAINVQTACSTSGVAVHLACQSLLAGDSDMVLVGGGRIQPPMKAGYEYNQGGPLSPDGYIRAFDANANGMVQGNGMAMLVLKKLDKAKADGDHIWAVIKGTAVNNDGSDKIGFTAPSIKGQAECIEKAMEKAGISPDSISYIEAHGTGTLLGDPIEIQGLTKAFQKHTNKKQFCAIGSVKTNVGHLDAGACAMGIIKTALALYFEKLPATLNFEKPNPNIDFKNSPFFVNGKLTEWKRNNTPRRAGVSAFGLGGTNAHIILEEAPPTTEKEANVNVIEEGKTSSELLLISAKTETSLHAISNNFSTYFLNSNLNSVSEIAHTLAVGRQPFKFRKALLVSDLNAASELVKKSKGTNLITDVTKSSTTKMVFMFPGGGAQYINMAKDLYFENTYFKREVDGCFNFLKKEFALDLKPLVFPKNESENGTKETTLERPSNALPALFTIEYALAKLWMFWGIQPTEMIGHSMGEYAAACLSGVMTLEEALRIVTVRGQLFETINTEGGMLSVPMPAAEVQPLLIDGLSIAVINKPDACVVSGAMSAIEKLEEKLTTDSVETKRIHISVAAHSAQVDPILKDFEKCLQSIDFKGFTIPFVSNVTGEWITEKQATSVEYWLKHIRQTVRFSDGLVTLFAKENRTFLEVGPGQTLSTFARQHPAKNKNQQILATTRHPKELQNDVTFLLKTVAKLWVTGQEFNWNNFYEGKSKRRVPLPTYVFDKKRFWIAKQKNKQQSDFEMAALPSINGVSKVEEYPEIDALETALFNDLSNEMTMENSNQNVSNKLINHSRIDILINEIKTILYELSGLEPEEMDEDSTFLELGFDSLFLSQVIIKVNNVFETKISFRQLFEEASTIQALTGLLDEKLPAEMFQPKPVVVENGNGSANGFAQNGNGIKRGRSNRNGNNNYPQNGNGLANEHGLLNELSDLGNKLNISNLSQNGEVKNLIQQQLFLMQQQLNLLQGKSNGSVPNLLSPSTNGRNGNGANGRSNGLVKSNGESNGIAAVKSDKNGSGEVAKELKIKRKSKGVTAKMGNYKNISSTDDLTQKQRANLQNFIERYIEKTASSKIMASRHRQFYADPRSVTGFSKLWKEIVYQIGHKKSKGAKIWDVDGNEYLDFVMSYGVALFGHAPDFVQEAIKKQVETGNSLDVLPPESTEVARMIAEISGMDRVTLANTGTEAVLGAVRAARTYSGKDKIAVFDTDYHGMIDQFMVRGVFFKDRTKSLPTSPGISGHIAENTLILDYDDPNVLAKIEANIKDLAAVVIEPVQAQNPHWQHFKLVKKLRELTTKHDVALIFDEVINGFRLAQRGAQAWYDVEADLVAYGKSISGGMPLSAVAGKEKYMESFDGGLWQFGDDSGPEASVTYFASTFIKNPMSVASAYAAMSEIERRGPNLQQGLNVKAARFAAGIREIFLRLKAPLFIQCTSSFFMIKPADASPLTRLFHYFLRYRGVNMRERPCFICTEHTDEDFQRAYEAIEGAIQDMFEADLLEKYEGEDLNIIQEMPAHLQVNQASGEMPLTEGQKEIFVSAQFGDAANLAYNIGTEIQLDGALKVADVEQAFQLLLQQHESLRISFVKDGSFQKVNENIRLDIPLIDLSNVSIELKKKEIERLHLEEANTPFDLETAPLIRAKMVKLEEEKHLVLMSVHHIVVDGWSLGILTHDLGAFYKKVASGMTNFSENGTTQGKQYSAFVTDQIALKQTEEAAEIKAFWKDKFKDSIPQNNFPIDNPRPGFQTYSADCQRLEIGRSTYVKIQETAAKSGSTFYFFLFGAFQSFVSRLAQQADLTIGIVAAGQNLSGNKQLVGHVANLLPIRMKIDGNAAFSEHLKSVRGELLDAFDHQNFTFGELVKDLKTQRDSSRNPLVSIVFNMDSPLENLDYGDLKVNTRPIQKQYETFDFFINIKPESDKLLFEWFYNTDLFNATTIQNRLVEFQVFLNSILDNPQQSISTLPLVKTAEIIQNHEPILSENQPLNIAKLFENQVVKARKNIALDFNGATFSYQKLNQKANQLAHFLIENGVESGQFVGVYLERSEDLIISLLAILKTGAAYLPLDVSNPKERLEFILNDVQAKVILTQESLENELPNGVGKTVCLEHFIVQKDDFWTSNLEQNVESSRPAYIIYTSGSTGNPKGIVISNKTIAQHLLSMKTMLNFSEKDTVFSVISASFDPSVQDFFLPLISGAKIVLADQKTLKDGRLLAEKLNQSEATWMAATPPTWRMLRLVGWNGKPNLNIISTGEALSKELANELLSCGENLWNFYGPTETTIYATAKKVAHSDLENNEISHWVSIGQSLPETPVYILDSNLQPLPPGTPGEVFIGGFRVANEYHQRPDLTATVFLDNPFKKGTKFYRTGDLGYQSAGGDIFYINRKDNQVKLRGYRIELGEIEAKIRSIDGVNEAVVLLREDVAGDKKLVAYFKNDTDNLLTVSGLRKRLGLKLPTYMIPADFVEMEKFPLTSAGKINRRQLPIPNTEQPKTRAEVAEATTKTEQKLAKIWTKLLNVAKVGVTDNFYELGGHSLLAVGMMVEIEKEFEVTLPLVTLLENATVAGIAEAIEAKLGKYNGVAEIAPKVEVKNLQVSEKTIPLTEGQTEIWVSHYLNEEAAKTFNLGSEIRLEGAVNVVHLQGAIQDVCDRHEALRTSILEDGKGQRILSKIEVEIPVLDYKKLDKEAAKIALENYKKEAIETPFDLRNAPLARFVIIQFSETQFSIILTMHHILLDGWSLGVLTNDLGLFYQQRNGAKVEMSRAPSQLSNYVSHLEKWKQSADYQESAEFWKSQFQGEIPVLKLPTTKSLTAVESSAAEEASIVLEADFIKKIRAAAKENRVSFYAYMFAAFQGYISRIVEQDKFVLGVSVSGKSIVKFNDLVAHRTNLLPLIVEVEKSADFASHLKVANRQLLTAFDYQDYTLGTLVKELKIGRDNSRHPIVNSVFNMETMSRAYDFGEVNVETEFIAGNHKTLDLIVHIKPYAPSKTGDFEFKWIYNQQLFTKEEVELRLAEFRVFLHEVLTNPDTSIGQLSLLPKREKEQILAFGKGEDVSNFRLDCLHKWLENQVLKTPRNIAVTFGETSLTYFELNKKANQLARFLIDNGLEINELVGLCLEQSADILIGIYAILKAGGTYVPIDPQNPVNRIQLILEDAKCVALISKNTLADRSENFTGKKIFLDSHQLDISKQNTSNINLNLSPDDLAYVIYTSGSTGKPKGVGIQHKSVCNTLTGINRKLELTAKDVFYSVSSMSFDMCIPDYFLSIYLGAKLILADGNVKKDGILLRDDLEQYQPTFMQATPTTWKILLLAGWQGYSQLKVLAGGEGFAKELAMDLLSKCHRVWNGYGPTETTIYATFKEVTWENLPAISENSFIPIGQPNQNVKLRILDENKNLVPIGVGGELYISGPGVSRGYLERKALTEKVFLNDLTAYDNADQRSTTDDRRPFWYKTGDFVRWLPNGDIDFLGRIDNQLKIRGFRVELGEIEECMKTVEGIEQSAVSLTKDENGREILVGYLVGSANFELDEKGLKTDLRCSLPGYMVPSIFVKMDEFPMSNSAKIDRKALPKPDFNLRSENDFLAPSTTTEKTLFELWKAVLKIDNLSITEDFFELGGHSLLAVGLMAKIQRKFDKKISVTVLFQNATIQKLAALIDGYCEDKTTNWTSLIPVKTKGTKPPIYLVHGGGLHVLFYQALAKNLEEDQPVYALQAHGLDGKNEPFDRIEEMAAHYISEILDQNPTGPYCLAGYSLGGLIAFEMAKQLEAMGKKVNLVAMFDAVAKYNWEGNDATAKWKKTMKKAGFNLQLMLKDPVKTAKYKAEVLKMQRHHLKGEINVSHDKTQAKPDDNQGNTVGKLVFEKSMAAFENYVLAPMPIRVDLFKAKEQMFFLHDPEFYGWQHFAENGVAVHELEGNHMNMFSGENGVSLAKCLQNVLDERNSEL